MNQYKFPMKQLKIDCETFYNHRFAFGVTVYSVYSEFSADSTLLVTTKWSLRRKSDEIVDPNGSRFDLTIKFKNQ